MNIHARSGIRTRDPNNQVAGQYGLDRTATEIGYYHAWINLHVSEHTGTYWAHMGFPVFVS